MPFLINIIVKGMTEKGWVTIIIAQMSFTASKNPLVICLGEGKAENWVLNDSKGDTFIGINHITRIINNLGTCNEGKKARRVFEEIYKSTDYIIKQGPRNDLDELDFWNLKHACENFYINRIEDKHTYRDMRIYICLAEKQI